MIAMDKKRFIAEVIISAFLFSLLAGMLVVEVAKANPMFNQDTYEGEIPPPEDVKPPIVTIFNPKNETLFSSSNISLTFNVVPPQAGNVISIGLIDVYYRVSWKAGNTSVAHEYWNASDISVNLADIPQGPSSLEVYVIGQGAIETHSSTSVTYVSKLFSFLMMKAFCFLVMH